MSYPVGFPYREKEGPGKGWWGPPKGTHGEGDVVKMSSGKERTPEAFGKEVGLWDPKSKNWELNRRQKIMMDEDEGEAWVNFARGKGKVNYYVHVKLKVPRTIDGEPTGRMVDWHARGKIGGDWRVLEAIP